MGGYLANTGLHGTLASFLTILDFMIQWAATSTFVFNNSGLYATLGGYLIILGFMIHWVAI